MTAIHIQQAEPDNTETISSILQDAAAWLEEIGIPLWKPGQLNVESIQGEVAAGLYWLAYVDGEPAGCIRYQLEDSIFWPDAILGEAAYLHKFAVRRAHASGGVSTALLDWAKAHARDRGHDFLRLDCETGRPSLNNFYERHGFENQGERDFGTHRVVLYQFDLNAQRDAN